MIRIADHSWCTLSMLEFGLLIKMQNAFTKTLNMNPKINF